jgi:chemotaxis protein histidine kinase CheA/methylmalonyl-CoA mutase cobalamin-binding subunit
LDWANSEELLELYVEEVDERSARLLEGAMLAREGLLDAESLDSLVRHAHTIKGSAGLMSQPEVAEAAAVLERSWRAVREKSSPIGHDLSAAMGEVARLIPGAARDPGRRVALVEAVRRLEGLFGPDEQDSDPDPNLGGLLASIEKELQGATTRVDTGDLYRLINRAVEIGLEVEALTDLAHVAIEGAHADRLIAAWKRQLEALQRDISELRDWAVSLANVTFGEVVQTFPQLARFVGRRLGKDVELETTGEDILVDRQVVDLLREPLRHLVVNAIDHGVEPPDERRALGKPLPATVRVSAVGEEGRLTILVEDDGRGIDWDAVARRAASLGEPTDEASLRQLLFRPSFSTVDTPNELSGTGEGLALVAEAVDRIGGAVSITSRPGAGTTVRLDVPASLVLQNVVVVAAGGQYFGISETAVLGATTVAQMNLGQEGRFAMVEGEPVPLVSLAEALGLDPEESETEVLLLSTRSGRVAVTVEEVVSRRSVAVKNLGPILDGSGHLVGAAFLGGRDLIAIVDHNYLASFSSTPPAGPVPRPRVLVVDDSAGVRQLISATLRGHGYEVETAATAREALRAFEENRFDVLVVDYAMPRSSGAELVRALRSAGVGVPVVMVSGVATEEDKAAAWEAGVDAYLDKHDLRRGALTSVISRLLGKKEDSPSLEGV